MSALRPGRNCENCGKRVRIGHKFERADPYVVHSACWEASVVSSKTLYPVSAEEAEAFAAA
jgi:hypothetical protein